MLAYIYGNGIACETAGTKSDGTAIAKGNKFYTASTLDQWRIWKVTLDAASRKPKIELFDDTGALLTDYESTDSVFGEGFPLVSLSIVEAAASNSNAAKQKYGDVEFDDFTYENNLVKLAPDNCPDSVLYKYVGESRYTPLFCSQPLYALLSFVAAQYKRMDNGSILDRIKNFVFNIFNNNELLFDEIVKMDKTRISNNAPLGYEVLCGGELFHYNH